MRQEQELVIEPNQPWFNVRWRELFHYRDLLFLLVRRDFVSQYKQTVLGPLWFIIQPLLTTIVFTVIFGQVARISTDGMPPLLFYLCGMLAWNYFAGCLAATSVTFVANSAIFGKVYFPRLIVPLSVVISRLIAFGIQLATFVVFLLYFKYFTPSGALVRPNGFILLLPLLLLQSAVIGLGVGLWMSALTAKYRDFSFLSAFMTQLWMYASPVIYPLSALPERWKWVATVNPMAGVVESYRYAFLGAGTVEPKYLVVSALMGVLLLGTGLLMFNRAERTFIDTV